MARFYDAVESAELARIETLLKNGGVEYSLRSESDDFVSEILVAEEDVAYAESLLASASGPERRETGMSMH